jgi:pimeloyl-ACP methyl ester carboxylesterase
MVSRVELQGALAVLERVSTKGPTFDQALISGEHPITAAVKLIHKTALTGSDKDRALLLPHRDRFVSLNGHLRSPAFRTGDLGTLMGRQASEVEGLQIALPQTTFERMVEVATRIPRVAFTILIDLLLLPGALALLVVAAVKTDFNPKPHEVKKGKTPILLLHGSNFNESQWVIGRLFLRKKTYGSVFSLNYDGLITNDPTKGISDYARDKISKEVKRIKELTGSDKVILMGHSMGGMIAGCYAEDFAQSDGVTVEHVFSIASPWQGTPLIDTSWRLGGPFSRERETMRFQQMSVRGATATEPNFRRALIDRIITSERSARRKYYSTWSSTDYAVPLASGHVTEDPRRQHSFSYLGHFGIVVWPTVWLQIRSWLDAAYRAESKAL